MADTITPSPTLVPAAMSPSTDTRSSPSPVRSRAAPLHELYRLPAPIRTFPLPTFFPNNPVSLVHLVWTWLAHIVTPPPAEPSVVHEGIWDPRTRSVHVTDPASMRALWEQGFYGKGSLSRSEPNWLKREQIRSGEVAGNVSEERTASRREERRMAKWERARLEQEAIEQTRLEEQAQAARANQNGSAPSGESRPSLPSPKPPVGPSELLSLPNSLSDLSANGSDTMDGIAPGPKTGSVPNGTLLPPPVLQTILASPSSDAATHSNGLFNGVDGSSNGSTASSASTPSVASQGAGGPESSKDSRSQKQHLKHRKSVRFSPTVESTTFQHHDPPNPSRSVAPSGVASSNGSPRPVNGITHHEPLLPSPKQAVEAVAKAPQKPLGVHVPIPNKEHLQLSPEEAFFLVFTLGVLSVKDPVTRCPIPPDQLLTLLRSYSHFPPRIPHPDPPFPGPVTADPQLLPDDPFLVHYAVYHHFRSLGWVPRHGVKFSVDWMLYQRGPVFDHAEFGLLVFPSYSDPWWRSDGRQPPEQPRSWRWLHGVNRVLSHVFKSLVLVYVDVPPPPVFDEAMAGGGGIAEALKRYRIREIMMRRWSSNRNR